MIFLPLLISWKPALAFSEVGFPGPFNECQISYIKLLPVCNQGFYFSDRFGRENRSYSLYLKYKGFYRGNIIMQLLEMQDQRCCDRRLSTALEQVVLKSSQQAAAANLSICGEPLMTLTVYTARSQAGAALENDNSSSSAWWRDDVEENWKQKEMRAAEDEMVGWYHWFNGHELGQTLGDGEGQGGLAWCSPWGRRSRTRMNDWTTITLLLSVYASVPLLGDFNSELQDRRILGNALWHFSVMWRRLEKAVTAMQSWKHTSGTNTVLMFVCTGQSVIEQ